MNEYLGNNIRTLRKAKNLTQEQFSEQLGVSFQSVSRWENSITYPDIEMIPKIARFFGVSTDYLFGIPEEDKYARLAELKDELQDLPEGATDRAIEIIQTIRLEYDMRASEKCNFFFDLCYALYQSDVKKTSSLIDELRKAAELFFDSNPNASAKSLVMPYYTRLEEEEYIPAFLDRFASDEETVSDALLYNRYLYRNEYDKLEVFRQRRLFRLISELIEGDISWNNPQKPNDVNFAFWKNSLLLDFLHSFNDEKPTEDHPIGCGLEPDVFVGQRIQLGQLRSCCFATLGRTDEAIRVLEDAVSLMEQVSVIPNGAILYSRSPVLPTFQLRIDAAPEVTGNVFLKYADDTKPDYTVAGGVFPEIFYERLMTDKRWAWFNSIRNDERVLALAERVKKLI